MELRRWTPLTYVAPDRFVDDDEFWADFDLEDWSRNTYEWTPDPWNGLLDVAKHPRETVADGTGDCEDYALVVVSWAVARGRDGIGIAFCWESPYPWPRHAIAFDAARVYSSGSIAEASVEEWIEGSKYALSVRRRVRS